MNRNRAWFAAAARETGYRAETLETVTRLGELAAEIARHPLLGSALALKGGTALNLCFGPPRRLSVDLDFNFVGSEDREEMLSQRPLVERSIESLAVALGYRFQWSRAEHAGRKAYLRYLSSAGIDDRIEMDLNFLHRVLLDHLQGRHVMGVYPLLEDETCCFLAVDFDQGRWREDVSAYVATAQRLGVTPAVERSQSGDGAHVWFFFSAPTSASAARKMGSYLLTEAMTCRPELPMSSYDRLFPNQDTMPRGGFGNLIALPLQYQPRQRGNTVFMDEGWKPLPDQWAFLAALPRLSPSRVEDIARDASARGRVLGVSSADVSEPDAEAPWLRLPFRLLDRPA